MKEKDEKVKAWVFIPVVLAVLPLILKFTVYVRKS